MTVRTYTMRTGLLLLLLISLPALPQTPPTPKEPPRSALEGQVVKDPGGLPVKKAEVQLIAEGRDDGTSYAATTDADGHFRIEGILAGRYRAFVERVGLVEIGKQNRRSAGTAISFEPGKDVSDLLLHMLPAAVIVGRVLDEDGDPMPRTDVSVLRYGYTLGRRRLETAASGTTNDLGEYRVPDLLPGSYLVAVNPTPDFSNLAAVPAAKPDSASKQETAYVPTYYPGTTDRSQAALLELHAGDETPVNFNLAPSATFHVRGSLATSTRTGTGAVLMLRPKDFNAEFTAAQVDKEGKFEIAHVPPGSYTLITVTGNADAPQIAQQPLEVTNGDINNLRIVPLAGSRVRGQVHVAGNPGVDLSSLLVFLRSGDRDRVSSFMGGEDLAVNPTLARVKRDGSFEMKDVPAGTYSLLVEGNAKMPDSYLKSASLGGTDVTDTGLSVGGGGTYSLDLVMSAGAGKLDGSVTDPDDHPVADAVVVAVPEGTHRDRLELYEKGVTDQHGRFSLTGLTPGDYSLFAFESVEEGSYYDASFLKLYESHGEKVHLEENGKKTIPLKVIPAAGDER